METDRLIEKAKQILYGNVKKFGEYRIVVPHLGRYPIPYCWDTAFHVLALSHLDPLLAKESIEALLFFAREDGLIPNAPTEIEDQDLRSQPPIILHAVKYYLDVTGDVDGLEAWYPKLKKFYKWWDTYGDPAESIEGLVSPFTGARAYSPKIAYWAVCSTGMDNHAVYDFTNGKTLPRDGYHYLAIEDLLLNSALAAGAEALAEIASTLKLKDDAKHFQQGFLTKALLINKFMWDENEGFYYPIDWKGNKIRVKSAQAFAPLFAKIPEPKDALRLIAHLASPAEFWGRYGVPSIAFNDENYMSQQPYWLYSRDPYYWRGPIWPPMACLAFKGLLNYGQRDLARQLSIKWLNLIDQANVFAEYYYEDGSPGLTNLSDFSWTAATTIFLSIEADLVSL